jgi:hypothetical protein
MGFLLWNVFHMTLLPDMKDFDVKANGESAPSARAVPSRGRRRKGATAARPPQQRLCNFQIFN